MRSFETIWDKTNIGENYPGVTSPLTYSFIRNAYSNVYANFMRLVGLDAKTVEANKTVFENMIGYVQGEVFYNINNWYELVKLLPGYKYNKVFFENMLSPVVNKKETSKEKITPGFLWSNKTIIFKFFSSILFIKPLYNKFEREYRENYKSYQSINLKELDNYEIMAAFESLQKKFFSNWAYTIVNDFRVMIYYGVLTKFVNRHFPNSANEIHSSIYGIKNKPDSIKPLKELIKTAKLIKSSKIYSTLFKEASNIILQKLDKPQYKLVKKKIDDYLNSFGERAFNELKLEEVNFKEKPESFIALLKQYVHYPERDLEKIHIKINRSKSKDIRSCGSNLNLINRLIFNFLVKNTRQSVYKREDYRLRRARVFNIAKEFFKEIAQRMVKAGDLEEGSDIFYLYTNEVFDYIRYHRLKENLKEIVEKRRQLLRYYEDTPLARRVVTKGLPNQEKIISKTPLQKKELVGKPTSQGVLREAEVVVMPKLDLEVDVKGKVLITETTDPGWTVLFPLIKGIIIEKGGVLSHASIVARELGIPCLIMQDATKVFETGNIIKLDAVEGSVSIL